MLLEFRVSNFRSIDSEEVISFVPDDAARSSPTLKRMVKKHGALPVVVLFGANGAGKTSFARAFEVMMQAMQLRAAGDPVLSTGFKLSGARPHGSRVSASIRAGKATYRYTVEVGGGCFVSETLEIEREDVWAEVLSRTSDSTIGKLPPSDEERRERLTADLHPQTSLLALLAAQSHGDARIASHSFRLLGGHMMSFRGLGAQLLAGEVGSWPNLERLLCEADLGIVGANRTTADDGTPVIHLRHHSADGVAVPIPLADESDGTKAMFDLAYIFEFTLKSGGVLVVDELGAHLNHWVVRDLIGTFQDPKTNPRHAQLVLTSHDPLLLDEKLLRSDQILLVDKDPVGASHVTAASDFEDLPKGSVLRSYLKGRLGGAPRFRALWSSLTPKEGAAKKPASK